MDKKKSKVGPERPKVVSLQRKRVDSATGKLAKIKEIRERKHAEIMLDVAEFVKSNNSERTNEDQQNAIRVVDAVLGWFVDSVPADGVMVRLAQLAKLVTGSVKADRAAAVEAIRTLAPFHADQEAVERLASILARNEGLQGVTQDIPAFGRRLASVTKNARGKKGKISATTLLAELIVDEKDSLGLVVDPRDDRETQVTKLQKKIDSDIARVAKKRGKQIEP